jgi:xylan 1,4-beta-xylosidase
VQALLWNYTPVAPPDNESDQIFYQKEQPARSAAPTALKITDMQDGSYTMNVYRTGYKQNDAYTAWLHLGSPNQLTPQQVTSLQSAASGAPVETQTITIRNGIFDHEFEMHENDTVLVILKKQ